MMKFFRKYTKHMLAVFMALLLIVWLTEGSLTYMFQGDDAFGKQVQGTAYGETVRLSDMMPAFHQTEVLNNIGLPLWQAPWFLALQDLRIGNPQQFQYSMRMEPLSREEWYMLDMAAQRAHVYVPPSAVEEFKNSINLTPDVLIRLRERTRTTAEQVDRAIQSLLRVREAAVQAAQAAKVSEADINDFIRKTGEKARITAVVIDAKPFIDPTWEPTREQILAHFEQYKNVASRPGEPGYQIPAAAQIEVIGISAAALASSQKIDEQEAYAYWKAHPNEFMKPATSTAPASQPVPYSTFAEARPKVIEKLQRDKARDQAQRIAREAIEKLRGSWARAATQPAEAASATAPATGVAATAPAGGNALYEKLAAELEARYPGAIQFRRLDLLTQEKMVAEPVGQAMAMPGSPQQITIARAAFMVPGLQEKPADPRQEVFYHELHETIPHAFVAADGDAYVMRTVAIRPAQAPDNADAVHNQIVEDLRRQHAVEEAEKAAKALMEQAAQQGLEAAFNADASLKQKLGEAALKKPEPFAQMMVFAMFGPPQMYPASIPGIGMNEQLINNLFALADKTSTQPSRVIMAQDPGQQRFIVAELHEILPVTRDEYEQQRAAAIQALRTQKRIEALNQWFDAEQIRARVQWQAAVPQTPEEEDEQTTG